jgi:hypothetical protein
MMITMIRRTCFGRAALCSGFPGGKGIAPLTMAAS